jgi:hypothetical protein
LILDVKVVPVPVRLLELIRLIEPRLTPLTFPDRMFDVEVKAPELIRLVVWLIPLTLEVIELPVEVNTLVVPAVRSGVRSKTLLATPLVVEVRFVPESPRELEFIIVPVLLRTPLTVDVKLFPVEATILE